MAFSVSSWWIDQTKDTGIAPVRKFFIGTSDYSSSIISWPRIVKSANEIKSVKVTPKLNNVDGEFNFFYDDPETMVASCHYEFGFTHPTSGDEMVTMYSGKVQKIVYEEQTCNLQLRDKLWDFTERQIGDSTNPVSMGPALVSDLAWTICTCYGGLSSVESTSNPDVDYTSFLSWAEIFSSNNINMEAYYSGTKIPAALKDIMEQSDSQVWVSGDGLITFDRFTATESYDTTITRDDYDQFKIDIDLVKVVNKALVGFDYSITSNYSAGNVTVQNSTSVNTFGIKEQSYEKKTVWYTNSIGALNLGQRITAFNNEPPKRFRVSGGLLGIHRELGEVISFVESFYNVDSSQAYRFVKHEFNMNEGRVTYWTDKNTLRSPFILDVSSLDGPDYLL